MSLEAIRQLAEQLRTQIGQVIVGKEESVELMLIALISSGHVLLEDVPGTGKTLLAKSLAKSLKLQFKRVQFTPDLLPTDLSGIHYYHQGSGDFIFRKGPLFTNILLADEINRATPRTQSSLLECMEERQLTIDGETRVLEKPFMVIATQNPIEHQGTFPLPEAQLDRFLFKINMGYPSTEEAMQVLRRFMGKEPLETLTALTEASAIIEAQQAFSQVKVHDDVLRYLVDIVESTRRQEEVLVGVSPRGSQALLRASQVHAVLRGRSYVTPDDIKALVKPTLAHRLALRNQFRSAAVTAEAVLERILQQVAVPSEAELFSS